MGVFWGEKKGLCFKSVAGKNTRPTTDKVKESIFNMLGQYFESGIVLDLFAGSGGLGIEALSRGMQRGIFIDRDAQAIAAIQENLKRTDLIPYAEVYRRDYMQALRTLKRREIRFDLVLLDPPYKDGVIEKIMHILMHYNLIQFGVRVVAEHHKNMSLPKKIGYFQQVKMENYGICSVKIYEGIMGNEE